MSQHPFLYLYLSFLRTRLLVRFLLVLLNAFALCRTCCKRCLSFCPGASRSDSFQHQLSCYLQFPGLSSRLVMGFFRLPAFMISITAIIFSLIPVMRFWRTRLPPPGRALDVSGYTSVFQNIVRGGR